MKKMTALSLLVMPVIAAAPGAAVIPFAVIGVMLAVLGLLAAPKEKVTHC